MKPLPFSARPWLFSVLLFLAVVPLPAQTAWEKLAPFFTPPTQFADHFGAYRSPLLFDNGQPVMSPQDWPARRREILKHWHQTMGPWPPLLERPQLTYLGSAPRENFLQHRVRVEVASRQFQEGYLLIPAGTGPFPAVLVPYYDPETSVGLTNKPLRDFALQLTRRGFVTLAIGSPGGDARRPDTGAATCQPLSFLAYVAANCHTLLAQLPVVDPQRIGVLGHSYGGKWALFAACLDERFAAGAWSDPGIVFDPSRPSVNYWEPWYLGREAGQTRRPGLPTADNPVFGAYHVLVQAGRDLHELQALMAPRPFWVSGGSEDGPNRWVALNHVIAVNRFLGHHQRVGMSNRPEHAPNAESNEQIYTFFEHFLKPQRKPGR